MNAELINSLEELKQWAERALRRWPPGSVVALSGSLGAGKTTLVRMVICLLCEEKNLPQVDVVSPTFTIHQSYPECGVEHFDLYRFEKVTPSELMEIGYTDAVENVRRQKGLLFVEWPEKADSTDQLQIDVLVEMEIISHQLRRMIEKVFPY